MKKNIIMIIMIILVILGVISGVVYLAATTDNTSPNLDTIETGEVRIDDLKLQQKLSESLKSIKYLGENRKGTTIYRPDFSGEKFDNASKLSTLFINATRLEEEHLYISNDDIRYFLNSPNIPDESLDEERQMFKVHPVKLIDEIYEETYGKKPDKDLIFKNGKLKTDSCPMIGISEDLERYIASYDCVGGKGAIDYTYEYKFTETNKHAYVYVAVAYVNVENMMIYKDYELTEEYMLLTDDIDPGKIGVNFINDDNYKEFSKYKVSFVKEDNQYYFENIVKVK